MNNDQAINTPNKKKQRLMIFKVVFAMTLFLVGLPFLLFLATSYYTNKGLVMDVYLMGHEYTSKIDEFYVKNKTCPNDKSIATTITDADIANKLTFSNEPDTDICTLTLTVRELGESIDGKILILSKNYNVSSDKVWQCKSTINSLYLPTGCQQIND